MSPTCRVAALTAVAGVLICAVPGAAQQPPVPPTPDAPGAPPAVKPFTDADVDAALARATEYLWSKQIWDPTHQFHGTWELDAEKSDAPQPNPRYAVGRNGLIAYALLESGVDPKHERLAAALDWLIRQDDISTNNREQLWLGWDKWRGLMPGRTYDLSMRACALAAAIRTEKIDDYVRVLKMDLNRLARYAYRGGYGYYCTNKRVTEKIEPTDHPRRFKRLRSTRRIYHAHDAHIKPSGRGVAGNKWDNSNSQCGVLGMWAAIRARFEAPRAYWVGVERHWARTQNDDGGWGYRGDHKPDSYPPMTAAGVASLFVAMDHSEEARWQRVNIEFEHKYIKAGMKWLEDHAEVMMGLKKHEPPPQPERPGAQPVPGGPAADPRRPRTGSFGPTLYLLYSIERVGVASGYKTIGALDWYKVGGARLLKTQQEDGCWRGTGLEGGVEGGTAFAMLFLGGGRRPVLFNKLQYTGDWNNRPRNIAQVVRWANEQYEAQVRWQIINIQRPVLEWHDAPILCLCGSVTPTVSDAEITRLREFVHQGGTLLSVTEGDAEGQAFAKGIREVYHRVFPDYELTPVTKTHPLRSVQYKLSETPELWMISNGIRPLVIHTDKDLSVAWQYNRREKHSEAFEAVANIAAYVTDKGVLRHRGVEVWPPEPPPPAPPAPGTTPKPVVPIVRVQYTGNWNPEPLALQRFAWMMVEHEPLIVIEMNPVKAENLAACWAKVAILSGTNKFQIPHAEELGLKAFIDKGGSLVIDAAGGSQVFYDSAREVLERLVGKTCQRLPYDAPIYAIKDKPLAAVRYRRATLQRTKGDRPRLDAMLLGNRHGVFLSREDLTAGLVGYSCHGVDGYAPGDHLNPGDAYKLLRNVVMWVGGAEIGPPPPPPPPATAPAP